MPDRSPFRRASMLRWYPLVDSLIPRPRTEIIEFPSGADPVEVLEVGVVGAFGQAWLDRAVEAGRRLGYPLFIRTDQASAKFEFERVSLVPSEDELRPRVAQLVDCNLAHDVFPSALVLRELVQADAGFQAFAGLPIGRERRYFAEAGKALCHHPYWPEPAMTGRTGHLNPRLHPDFRAILAGLNRETPDEVAHLSDLASRISASVKGEWSVDFMRSRDGRWLWIDMAPAEVSRHAKGCPRCPSGQGDGE